MVLISTFFITSAILASSVLAVPLDCTIVGGCQAHKTQSGSSSAAAPAATTTAIGPIHCSGTHCSISPINTDPEPVGPIHCVGTICSISPIDDTIPITSPDSPIINIGPVDFPSDADRRAIGPIHCVGTSCSISPIDTDEPVGPIHCVGTSCSISPIDDPIPVTSPDSPIINIGPVDFPSDADRRAIGPIHCHLAECSISPIDGGADAPVSTSPIGPIHCNGTNCSISPIDTTSGSDDSDDTDIPLINGIPVGFTGP